MQQQHGILLQALSDSLPPQPQDEAPAEIMVATPFNQLEAFQEFDATIHGEKAQLLIKELHGIGGDDAYCMTRRLLEHVLSDTVASKYSWCGQKGKKKFVQLNLKAALFAAIKKNKKIDATDNEIEKAVKSWLRHAPARMEPK